MWKIEIILDEMIVGVVIHHKFILTSSSLELLILTFNFTKDSIVIVIDEAHLLIGKNNPVALNFVSNS